MTDVISVVQNQYDLITNPTITNITVEGSTSVIETVGDSYTLSVESQPVQVITLGIQGPQGPQGIPGTGASTFIFSQGTPQTTWSINHNLGQFPALTVVDSGGTVVVGTYNYVDSNNITLTFTVAFGGKAFLNV